MVTLFAVDEDEGLLEAAYRLRSPVNAAPRLAALERARAGKGEPRERPELRARFATDKP